jgi:hypothetical protein
MSWPPAPSRRASPRVVDRTLERARRSFAVEPHDQGRDRGLVHRHPEECDQEPTGTAARTTESTQPSALLTARSWPAWTRGRKAKMAQCEEHRPEHAAPTDLNLTIANLDAPARTRGGQPPPPRDRWQLRSGRPRTLQEMCGLCSSDSSCPIVEGRLGLTAPNTRSDLS